MGLFFRRKDGIFKARRFRMKSRYFFLNFAFCMALGTHAQLPEAHWSAQTGVASSISGKVLTWGSVGLQSPVASSSSNFAGPFVDSSLSGISNRAAIRFGLGSGSLEPLYFPDIVVDTPTIILIANVPSFNHSMHYALSAMQGTVYRGGIWVGGMQSNINGIGIENGPPYKNRQCVNENTGWQAYAYRWDTLFVNGQPQSNYSLNTLAGWSNFAFNTIGGISIGSLYATHHLEGWISEILIYRGTLSTQRIQFMVDSLIQVHCPLMTLGPDIDSCATQLTLAPLNGATFNSYLWSTGATGPSITIQQNGTYWLETRSFGRVFRDSIVVTGLVPVPILAGIAPDTLLCKESPFFLHPQNLDSASVYVWNSGHVGDSLLIVQPGTYYFTAVSGNCALNSNLRNIFSVVQPGFTSDLVCLGDTTTLSSTSFCLSGTLTDHLWDFGDGGSDTNSISSHAYIASGSFWATLIVKNSENCSDTLRQEVRVKPLPNANFSFSGKCRGQEVAFNNLTQSPPGETIAAFSWYFPGQPVSNQVGPKRVFPLNQDTFHVALRAGLTNGCFDSISTPVVVNKSIKILDYSIIDSICQFSNLVATYTPSVENTVLASPKWLLNGVLVSQLDTLVRQSETAGYNNVVLVLESTDACFDTAYMSYYSMPAPESKLVLSAQLGVPPLILSVADATPAGYATRLITLNNGSLIWTDSLKTIELKDTGYYMLSLVSTDPIGCIGKDSIWVRVIEASLRAQILNLACPKKGGYYYPECSVQNLSDILNLHSIELDYTLGHLNMGKREYADTLAPGSILHTPLEAGLSSSSPPTYCCASVPRALSTLESGTTLEVSIPETCISLIGDPAIGSIVPNPASEKTTLYLLNAKDLPFNLTIVDMKGREVFHQNALANEAVYPIALVVSDWAAGTYQIVFSVGSIALTASLVVE
jgi:PKD repeat protein